MFPNPANSVSSESWPQALEAEEIGVTPDEKPRASADVLWKLSVTAGDVPAKMYSELSANIFL